MVWLPKLRIQSNMEPDKVLQGLRRILLVILGISGYKFILSRLLGFVWVVKKDIFDIFELQDQSLNLVTWILIVHHKVSPVGLLIASKQELKFFFLPF